MSSKMIGPRLKELRRSMKLPQWEMAELLGVSQSSVDRYERNTARPTVENLLVYADYSDVSLDYQIDPRTAPVVLEMFTRYDSGATMKEIRDYLNDTGVTTVWGKPIDPQIIQEEMKHPLLSRGDVTYWICRFRTMDVSKLEERRRLIDSFVNSVTIFDDYILITFNYKEGPKRVTFDDIESSDLKSVGRPY